MGRGEEDCVVNEVLTKRWGRRREGDGNGEVEQEDRGRRLELESYS